MTDLVIEDFFGKPLIVCPNQSIECKYQYPMGDGAFLGCRCDECYKTRKCLKIV